ncbi:MAG: DNA translocase FtsK 4TM domain-containing protein [Clostridia bacterium]|nr:DNA translocase FtsK 4TM domain-containing protein [Clostridia bacterium]
MGLGRRKKTTKKIKNSFKINNEVAIVILIFAGILSGALIYLKSGVIGQNLSNFLGGIFGIVKYILPIGFIAVAVSLIQNKKDYVTAKLIQYAIIISCVCTILSIYEVAITKSLFMNQTLQNILEKGYYLGTLNKGGGVIGAFFAFPLIKLLGVPGTIILTIGLAVTFIVFMFGVKPSEIIGNIIDRIKERREYSEEDEPEEAARPETKKERRLREQEEKRKQALEVEQLQLKIEEKGNLNPLGMDKNSKHSMSEDPEYIEGNLFKQEEEKKADNKREVLQLEHAMIVEDEHYEYPPINLLSRNTKKTTKAGAKALTDTAAKLQKTLYSFGVSAKVENVTVGPAITRYELKPAEGVRVSKIANLADDIALNLAAETLRIEAPIPGKQAVGIEVPNKEREAVGLREVIESDEFENNKSKLSVALGKDVAGQAVVADIAKMPHVLIAGSTGSGKSVCINTIITSIIYNAKPSEVKMVMVDPKVVELSVYNGIPHLLIPVVTDPRKAAGALAWAVQEMDDRYNKFAMKGVRDLKGYNAAMEADEMGTLPQIIIIIDELADLMMVAAKEVEDSICRLAQKARAAGMHLVIATQRPSVDVITGLIKANVPSRIAFAVSSQVDSRTILDMSGAEKLLGKGDMLFYPAGASKPARIQGAFVSDGEVEKIVGFIKANGTAHYNDDILESIEKSNKTDKELDEESDDDDTDPFLMEAMEVVVETGQASTSFIQRKFKVGYARAGRIIDQLEERGIISGYQGSKPRQVLMTKERLEELKMSASQNTND